MRRIHFTILFILATWMFSTIQISLAKEELISCSTSNSNIIEATGGDPLYTYLQNNLCVSTNSDEKSFTICSINNKSNCANISYNQSITLGSFDQDPILSNNLIKNFTIYSKQQDTTLCVLMDTTDGKMPLTCKNVPIQDVQVEQIDKTLSPACYGNSKHTQSKVSFGGQTIECLRSTLDVNFFGKGQGMNTLTPFNVFQQYMQSAISAALSLYVIFYGIKIVLNPEQSTKTKEVFMFILKIILVLYFAAGSPIKFLSNEARSTGGMTDIILPLLLSAFDSFPNIVYQAAGNTNSGLCYFDPTSYEPGYSYYAMWDSLDCRIGYYMGGGKNKTYGNIIAMIFLNGNIMMFLYSLAFIVLMLSISLNIISSFVVYLITIYVLVYTAPIFIPMSLFDYTKGYFDSWSKLLLSYAIQPFVIVAFLALAITVFDTSLNGTCQFTEVKDGSSRSYEIKESTDSSCTDSYAYALSRWSKGDNQETKKALFFSYSYIKDDGKTSGSMFTVVIFFIIFYYLLESTNKMAAALSGGIDVSSMVFSATALASKVSNSIDKASGAANNFAKSMLETKKTEEK